MTREFTSEFVDKKRIFRYDKPEVGSTMERELPKKLLAILRSGHQPSIEAVAASIRTVFSASQRILRDTRKLRRIVAALAVIAGTGVLVEILDHIMKIKDSTPCF